MKSSNWIMSSTLSLTVVLTIAGVTPAFAQSLVRSVNGPAANAKYGKACIVVSDQNGDGYKDLLVGAPGFNQERGAIYCLSGAFLASGVGTQTLWSLAPTANQGDLFGSAIACVDDATGDGVDDYLVGQPGYDTVGVSDRGAVRLINGASHAAVSLIYGAFQGSRMGQAIAATGSLDTDQRTEVIVGSPGNGVATCNVHLIRNSMLASSGLVVQLASDSLDGPPGSELGATLAAGADYEYFGSFGAAKFIVGAPGWDSPGAVDAGKVVGGTLLASSFNTIREYASAIPGERLGASVDCAHDYDGDGHADYVVGAPFALNGTAYEVGRAAVLSSLRILQQNAPYEIHALPFGSVAPPASHIDPDPNFHFGDAVRACDDLNGDGVGEILVGAPDYFTPGLISGWNFRGLVRVVSGASGQTLATLTGASTDRLGDGLAGAIDDFDGDGFEEFIVAGSLSDAGGSDSGVVKCYRLFPLAPSTYCVGKLNSLGCTPAIGSTGVASASSGLPFQITCSNLVNQKNGLLFYSHRPTAVLFQGGTLCVESPTVRTQSQNSGGAASGSSCSGVYSMDFNAWLASGIDPALAAGAEVYAQYWSRDPASPSKTSLSNALRFVVNP